MPHRSAKDQFRQSWSDLAGAKGGCYGDDKGGDVSVSGTVASIVCRRLVKVKMPENELAVDATT